MGRFLRSFSPFLLSLAFVIAANIFYEVYFLGETEVTGQVNSPPADTAARQTPVQSTRPPIATAIANRSEDAPQITPEYTPAVQPTILPSDFISLSGPPAESRFAQQAIITFYWQSLEPLSAGQRFQMHLYGEEEEVLLGELDEPNLGQGYQIAFSPAAIDLPDGQYSWQVQLIDERFAEPISSSELRSIVIFGR